MKFPLVLRSNYEKLEEDYHNLKQIASELNKENFKLASDIYTLKKKHNQEIQEVTEQVNKIIGKLVNLEREIDYSNPRYVFKITAPIKFYKEIDDEEGINLLSDILAGRIINIKYKLEGDN
jgi:predicted nuclease with TOPRIM domain